MTAPPRADKRPHVHREHGTERDDPWFWLRERENPEVLRHLEAENAWTEQRTAHLRDLEEKLYAEMIGRVQEADDSAPVPHGPWAYFRRTFEGKSYPALCRRPRDGGGDEQILLDVNVLAEGHDFTDVAMTEVSPDHRWLAYAIDHDGDEIYTIRFVDLETGNTIEDHVPSAAARLAWGADSRTVYWLELDDAHRTWRLHRKTLGEPSSDEVLFEEADERFSLGVETDRACRFVTMYVASNVTTELHLLDATDPNAELRVVQRREPEIRYDVAVQGDTVWVVTNETVDAAGKRRPDAPNGRLMRTTLDALTCEHWQEVLAHRPDVELTRLEVFAEHLVLLEREAGQLQVRVIQPSTGADAVLEMPETVATVGIASNPEYDTPWLRITYTSMTTPPTVYRIHLDDHRRELVKQSPVPGYDPARYRTERRFARAPDGTEVPMSVVMRRDLEPSADTPLLLHGYGSYGITNHPRFANTRVSLLDRGVVFVIAHVRGSSFYGRPWYDAGKLEHKQNTFTDFAACLSSLHDSGLSSPAHTAILGGSAGGLLVGAVINQRPELVKAAVAAVPFVDVVTTMLDVSLPLTAREWDEWGDPREPEPFARMLAYSPYDNVKEQAYPNLLVTSGLNDSRVQYWEPAKWVAKLRDRATAGDVLLRTNLGAGHAGPSGRYDALRDVAKDYAWLLDQLGATERLTGA